MNDRRIREILEPRPPRLSGEAAQRIEARVVTRMERGRRLPRTLALTLGPAMLALVALLWLLPRNGETPKYFLVSEEQFAEYLGQWENSGGDADELLDIDYELDDENWSQDARKAFLEELDNFSLDTI